jgi:aromatic ring hydroxylase
MQHVQEIYGDYEEILPKTHLQLIDSDFAIVFTAQLTDEGFSAHCSKLTHPSAKVALLEHGIQFRFAMFSAFLEMLLNEFGFTPEALDLYKSELNND